MARAGGLFYHLESSHMISLPYCQARSVVVYHENSIAFEALALHLSFIFHSSQTIFFELLTNSSTSLRLHFIA